MRLGLLRAVLLPARAALEDETGMLAPREGTTAMTRSRRTASPSCMQGHHRSCNSCRYQSL